MTKATRSRAADAASEQKTATRTPRKKPASAATSLEQTAGTQSASALVRVYRHMLGDCILVRLRKRDGGYYKILIDCGVAVATPDAKTIMTKAVQDVMEATEKEIDLLVLTHEHWDHVSGFIQAEELFDEMKIGEIWVAWTENPDDELAAKLRKEHADAAEALGLCLQKIAMAGDSESSRALLDVLGVAGKSTDTAAAFSKAKALAEKMRYCLPTDQPVKLDDPDVRIFVLGPPHDEKLIKQTLPSRTKPETYELAADQPVEFDDPDAGKLVKQTPSKAQPETCELALDGTGVLPYDVAAALKNRLREAGQGLDSLQQLSEQSSAGPFPDTVTIPFVVAQGMPFFQNHYWGASAANDQWRRIDTDWLASSEELALAIQSATNNTSLVLAIELPNKEVLLFAADAQIGNWLSWQDRTWTVDGETVTGPDLLSRTVFYKVGHHGSMNATLKDKGLKEMATLHTAIIPVDQKVAEKMRWGNMPLESLLAEFNKKTGGRAVRTDLPTEGLEAVTVTDLYCELAIG